MTLEQLRTKYRQGEISATEALQLVAPHLTGRSRATAADFVNEIIGLPDDPKEMTAEERTAASRWEKSHRDE